MDSNKQILEFLVAISEGNGRALRIFVLAYQTERFSVQQLQETLEIPQSAISLRLKPFRELNYVRLLEQTDRNGRIYEFVKETPLLLDLPTIASLPEYQKDYATFCRKFLE